MSFRYTRPPVGQHLLLGLFLGAAIFAGSTDAGRDAWAALVTSHSDRALVVGGLLGLHTVVFWTLCAIFHRADTTDRPQFIARHRIQLTHRRHPPAAKAVRVLVRNHFIFLPVLLLGVGEVLAMRGWVADPQLPTLGRLAFELLAQTVSALVIFYATHRFFHRKWWVKHVHRVHHEFRTTTALASEYAHPVEFVVGNFMTLAGGALLFAPHLASVYLFALLATLTFVIHHSGYALPWAPWALPHDWHHYYFKEMFGTIGVIDRLMGTDREFQNLQAQHDASSDPPAS